MPGATAPGASTKPPPVRSGDASTVAFESAYAGTAEPISAERICAGDHSGWRSRMSATTPVTAGAAIDVPSQDANAPG